MSVQIMVDEALLEKALSIGGNRSKTLVVAEALKEYIARREKAKLPEYFGMVEFTEDFQQKQIRRRR